MSTSKTNNSNDDNKDCGNELLERLRNLTDPSLDESTGNFYLEMCEGNVETAASFYLEQQRQIAEVTGTGKGTGTGTGTGSGSSNAASITKSKHRRQSSGTSTTSARSMNSSSIGGGTSRRRAKAVTQIPASLLEDTVRHDSQHTSMMMNMGEPATHMEPTGGLITGRRNRGFARNSDLLEPTMMNELDFYNQAMGSLSLEDAIYGPPPRMSEPGAFNESETPSGMITRTRRDASSHYYHHHHQQQQQQHQYHHRQHLHESQQQQRFPQHYDNERYHQSAPENKFAHHPQQPQTQNLQQRPHHSQQRGHRASDFNNHLPQPPRAQPLARPHHLDPLTPHSIPNTAATRTTQQANHPLRQHLLLNDNLHDDHNGEEDIVVEARLSSVSALTDVDFQQYELDHLSHQTQHQHMTARNGDDDAEISILVPPDGVGDAHIVIPTRQTCTDDVDINVPSEQNYHAKDDAGIGLPPDQNNNNNNNNRTTPLKMHRLVSQRNYACEPAYTHLQRVESDQITRTTLALSNNNDSSIHDFFNLEDNDGCWGGGPRISNASTLTSIVSGGGEDHYYGSSQSTLTKVSEEKRLGENSNSAKALAVASALKLASRKPDPPGGTMDSPLLYDNNNSIDNDNNHNKVNTAQEESQQQCEEKSAPEKHLPHEKISQQLKEEEHNMKCTMIERDRDAKVRRAPATKPGAVSVGIDVSVHEPNHHSAPALLSDHHHHHHRANDAKTKKTSTENKKSSHFSESALPVVSGPPKTISSEPTTIGKRESHSELYREKFSKNRRVPATTPGAVSIKGQQQGDHQSHRRAPAEGKSHRVSDAVSGVVKSGEESMLDSASPPTIQPHAAGGIASVESLQKSDPPAASSTCEDPQREKDRIKKFEDNLHTKKRHVVPATKPGAVKVKAEEPMNESLNSLSVTLDNSNTSNDPIAVSSEKKMRHHRPATHPGAVSVSAGEDDDLRSRKEKAKASGLCRREPATRPGAVSASANEEDSQREKTKMQKFRLGPDPEQVRLPSSGDDSKESSKSSKDGKRANKLIPKKPGAVSVTSADEDLKLKDRKVAGKSSSSSEGEHVSDGTANSNDPTLELPTADHGGGDTAGVIPASLPLPKPLPRNEQGRSKYAQSAGAANLPKLVDFNTPVPINRRASASEGKKGRFPGLSIFKKHKKEKHNIEADVGKDNDEDPIIALQRTGGSRPFSPADRVNRR